MIGEGEGGYQSPEFHKNCGLSVRDYVPIMLKFGTKQYTVGGAWSVPNLSLIGDSWVCTGAPKFPLLVRLGVFQCFYHQSADQTCKKLM